MVAARFRSRPARGAATACVLLAMPLSVLGACQAIAGIEDRSTGAASTASDATTSDGPASPVNDAEPSEDGSLVTCQLTDIPDKPDADTSGDGEEVNIIAAISTFTLPGTPDSAAPPALGYDLDGVCTCCDAGCAHDNGGSCRASGGLHCDLAGGVDNSGGLLFTDYTTLTAGFPLGFHLSEPALNQAIISGGSTLVFEMKNWNNDDNDTSVELSFFPSNGTAYEDGGSATTPPRFDGMDIWTYTPSSVLADIPDGATPTDYPQFRSTSAYVREKTLYAQLATLDLTLGDTALHLTDVKLSADISNAGGVYKFSNGILAGRWPTENLLYRFGVGALNSDCSMSATYLALKGLICAQADLRATDTEDGKGTDDPATEKACNAVSVSFGFSAVSALLGAARVGVPVVSSCPTFTDDCN